VLQPDASVMTELANRDDAWESQDVDVTLAVPDSGSDTWIDPCAGVVCKDDGLFCNGTEACNPSTGKCVHQNVPSCGTHGSCNEFTDSCSCDPDFAGSTCNTCAPGTTGTYPNCVEDPCSNVSCNGHGTCNSGSGACQCSAGFDPQTNCNSCLAGYSGPTCTLTPPPAPTISGLAIDCSGGLAPGYCVSGSFGYPVTFSSTNATSYTVTVTKVSGTGTPGSASGGSISGSPTTFQYSTGSDGSQVDRITATVTGSGGQASASINVNLD
jgi:hypothetical protein